MITPHLYPNAPQTNLQLHIVIQQPNLLARLESRHANIRTPITTERISQATIPARPDLSLNCEVDFCEIVCAELEGLELRVGVGSLVCVFGLEFLCEPAGAVFAGAATLADPGGAFFGWGLC